MLTSVIQRHPRSSGSPTGVNETTPALLTSTLAPPSSRSTRSASASTDTRDVTSTSIATARSPISVAVASAASSPVVGDHDPHPLGHELLGDATTQAARGTGDDRRLPLQVLHGPWSFSCGWATGEGRPSSTGCPLPEAAASHARRSRAARRRARPVRRSSPRDGCRAPSTGRRLEPLPSSSDRRWTHPRNTRRGRSGWPPPPADFRVAAVREAATTGTRSAVRASTPGRPGLRRRRRGRRRRSAAG